MKLANGEFVELASDGPVMLLSRSSRFATRSVVSIMLSYCCFHSNSVQIQSGKCPRSPERAGFSSPADSVTLMGRGSILTSQLQDGRVRTLNLHGFEYDYQYRGSQTAALDTLGRRLRHVT